MDSGDRAPVGTFFVDDPLDARGSIALSERANQHARVKRMQAGNAVRLVDGRGAIATGTIRTFTKGVSDVEIETVTHVPRPTPVHVRVPIGDRERMLWVAEKATEFGVESWQAVLYHRSRSVAPRGEGEAFAEKVRARMISALEQSGGAWLPRILADTTPDRIDVPDDARRVVLDASGDPLLSLSPSGRIVLTFGPEGGFEENERARLVSEHWKPVRLAATTLRFETAGLAAIAVIRAAQILEET